MSNSFYKVLPKGLKLKIADSFMAKVLIMSALDSAKIPKPVIEAKHIKNTKLLASRNELLDLLKKNAIVAELGVDQGKFSEKILKQCTPRKLHLIDVWGSERYGQNKKIKVEEKFLTQIKASELEINLGLSTSVVKEFDDKYFDWIYIDTDHSYLTTVEELELYRPKMKDDGVIAGHDFIVGNWDGMVRYGVIEAVYEFCLKYNWEIIYLTIELDSKPSFAIRKMKS